MLHSYTSSGLQPPITKQQPSPGQDSLVPLLVTMKLECVLCSILSRCGSCTCVWHTHVQCGSRRHQLHLQVASSVRCRSTSSRSTSRRSSRDVRTTRPSRRTPETAARLQPRRRRSICSSASTSERDTTTIRTLGVLVSSFHTNHHRVPYHHCVAQTYVIAELCILLSEQYVRIWTSYSVSAYTHSRAFCS